MASVYATRSHLAEQRPRDGGRVWWCIVCLVVLYILGVTGVDATIWAAGEREVLTG